MLEKISDRVYYMMNADETDRPVLGVVIGDHGSLIIDAGNSPEHANEFKKELDALNLPPVKYLVITHYHWDHTFGIREWDAVSVANQLTIDHMDRYRRFKFDDNSLELARQAGVYSEYSVKCIKAEFQDQDREHFSLGDIDICYYDRMKIDLGGVTCEVCNIISPHTDDSTIVYVPEEKVLFLGDCIYGNSKNGNNYFDPAELFPMVDVIEQYKADYYICSHESACTREEIVAYWQQLRTAYGIVSNCATLEEAVHAYRECFDREPSGDMLFYLNSFGLSETVV